MFLNISCLGVDSVCDSAIPPKQVYENITFYGESYIDNLQVLNYELTNAEIQAITTVRVWNAFTILLANYENSTEAGNLQNVGLPITHWRIFRKQSEDSVYTLLAEQPLSLSNSTYLDYTVENQKTYDYLISTVSNGTQGQGIGGSGMADFFGWILTDGTNTYNFDMELESSNIQTIQDFKKYDNFTQYPAFRFGEREYIEGNLKTIPYEIVSNDISINLNVLQSLKAFINNKQSKILKNPKGESWEVITYDFSYKYYDKVQSQPYTVEFSYTQIGDGE